jgi:membrane-bound lytic murein transglycosylase MltF
MGGRIMFRWLVPVGVGFCLVAGPAGAQTAKPDTHHSDLFVSAVTRPWTGDLDGMIERRLIRVLTVYSKTIYFIDRGTQRGTAHDAMKRFEETINKKLKTRHLRVSVAFIPVSREELLPALAEGRGDIAAANLTITPERERLVDFQPVFAGVNEIVITGPASPPLAGLDDLAGKDVFVRRSSSYFESLTALNARFRQEGKAAVTLTPAPEELEDEDLLEMLNAGLVKIVVIDSHKAELWKQVFPKLKVHPDIVVRTEGTIGWAVRKDSPRLKAELESFAAKHGQGSAFANETLRRYLKSTRYVKNATADAEMRKFQEVVELFRRYGGRYELDWMLMAAQGYQESRLDHNARSPVGAIGVMQVMPATGRDLKVGDITLIEPNVHAGVKYIRFMIDQYYKNEPMDELNKHLFAFAAYNAGPGRVSGLRREAQKQGLDPNIWFHNVERIAAAKIGRETVTYVSNIYKYYVAYALVRGEYRERIEARQRLTAAPAR